MDGPFGMSLPCINYLSCIAEGLLLCMNVDFSYENFLVNVLAMGVHQDKYKMLITQLIK